MGRGGRWGGEGDGEGREMGRGGRWGGEGDGEGREMGRGGRWGGEGDGEGREMGKGDGEGREMGRGGRWGGEGDGEGREECTQRRYRAHPMHNTQTPSVMHTLITSQYLVKICSGFSTEVYDFRGSLGT